MVVIILLVCLVVPLLTQTLDDWALFKVKFGKVYTSWEQQQKRMLIWQNNVQTINTYNSYGYEYTLEINSMSDLSESQIQQMTNVLVNSSELNATAVIGRNLKVNFALKVDWRQQNKVSKVRDQGRCGCCWAFASIATVQSFLALTTGKLYDLSQEYLLECTNGSDCSGGYVGPTMTKILSGVPNQTSYPYKASMMTSGKPISTGICTYSNLIKPDAILNRYVNLTDDQLKMLVTSHPVTVHFKAESAFSSYKKGVYSCQPNTSISQLNHAVSLVGYDTNGNYLIKNSWNQWWGEDGFGYVDWKNDCGIKLIVYEFKAGVRVMGGTVLMILLAAAWI